MNPDLSSEPATGANAAASFDRAAARYREHARVQAAMAEWLAEWLPPERSGRALEVGAGPGVFTRLLTPWKGSLVATDISAAMCAAGRTALPELTWRVMSAEAPFRGPWDWIFSSSMLQWSVDPATTLGAWREQLASDGRVLAGLFVSDTLPELRAVLGEAGPVQWRTVEGWRDELARSGLRLIRDEAQRRVVQYGSARELMRSLHGIGAAPERRISPARLRTLLGEYERRFPTHGGVRATWTFYRFEAGFRVAKT